MRFADFKEKYGQYPVINSAYFSLEENPAFIRRQVSEWQNRGWLIELRRGEYLINDRQTLRNVEPLQIANLLYEPSYISLESALSFYGLIPEGVKSVTSVSSRKTTQYINPIGKFSYSKIKIGLYWGFCFELISNRKVQIASPVKALLDTIYLRRGSLKSGEEVMESLRIQQKEALDLKDLRRSVTRFGDRKITKVGTELIKILTSRK